MIQPYLIFDGNCKEALTFYKHVFDVTETVFQLYNDYVPKEAVNPPADLKDWVLHAELNICGTPCWFADEITEPVARGNHIILTLTVPEKEQAQQIYERLTEKAQKITLPPTQTFYSSFHAGIADQFGISWNIVVTEAPKNSAQG